MSSPSPPFLSVRDLRTYYHTDAGFARAVDGVSFDVPHRRWVGLAGASGSGKTQTVRSVLGLLDGAPGIVDGEVWIEGVNMLAGLTRFCTWQEDAGVLSITKDVARWRTLQARRLTRVRGRQIGMVFQEPQAALVPYRTVAAHVRETLQAHGQDASAWEAQATALLRRLRFDDPRRVLRSYPYELSGGESQRVVLGLALLGRPRLLIADEPTTLLDAVTQRQVLDVLVAVAQERDLAMLLVSHDLALLRLLVDEVVILFAGTVVERGPATAVIDPSNAWTHPYTQDLLAALPKTNTKDAALPPASPVNTYGCRYAHACRLKKALPEGTRRRCLHEAPPAVHVGDGHLVACWARADDR